MEKIRLTVLVLVASFLGTFLFGLADEFWGSFSTGSQVRPSPQLVASEIIDPSSNYILYFRHAEREKYPLVTVYDYFQIEENRNGRAEEWAEAVCLSERGIQDAKVARRVIVDAGLRVGKVFSSPSCRSLETAELVFGGHDEVSLSILHPTAVVPDQQQFFATNLRSLLIGAVPQPGSVSIVVGHGNTLDPYESILFGPESTELDLELDELGFVVIEIVGDELEVRHVFKSFADFANQVLRYEDAIS